MVDLNTFRQQVLADSTLEERVEVNQRHLIDKILARYSTEYTFHRELLQNANDAGASTVEIVFHTRSEATANPEQAADKTTTAADSAPAAVAAAETADDEPQMVGAFPSQAAAAQEQAKEAQKAKSSEIKRKYKGLTLAEKCTSISFKNNGRDFSTADWNRLRSIASGNPDENKIGFFGVGFYSLFSVCEEPFVISGDDCMAFYWRGDQLYTKKTQMENRPPEERGWTTFLMQLRDGPSQIPDPPAFARFLATSLAFTANLMEVVVRIDDVTVIQLSKRVSDPMPLTLKAASSGLFGAISTDKYHLRTPEGILSIQSVDTRIVQMTCDYVRRKPKARNMVADAVNDAIGKTIETAAAAVVGSGLGNLFSGWANSFRRKTKKAVEAETSQEARPVATEDNPVPEDVELEERSEFLFLKIAEAAASSHVSSQLSKQIERSTKKCPPKSTAIRVIWNGLSEQEALEGGNSAGPQADSDKSTVFSQLISYPSQGRVFIGFPTHQTTGCCAHLAAALIPTVERESIDFVDPALATWNKEILSAFAILCRILYDFEVEPLGQNPRILQNKDELDRAIRANAHALHFFTPHDTTPSPHVGSLLRQIFFACGKYPVQLMTSVGLRSAAEVRVASASSMTSILRTTPLLSHAVETKAGDMVRILRQFGYLKPLSINDVIEDIRQRGEFTDAREMGDVLRWWIGYRSEMNLGRHNAEDLGRRLCSALVLRVPVSDYHSTGAVAAASKPEQVAEEGKPGGTIRIALSEASYFINQKATPLCQQDPSSPQDTQMPPACLPPSLSGQFNQPQLHSMFTINGRSLWSELPLTVWVLNLTSKSRITIEPAFAELVLGVVSRSWTRIPETDQATIASALASCACILTADGKMLLPRQTYFHNANIFGNLPVVEPKLERTLREQFLTAIGVCKHVNLQMVFDRLGTELNWDHVQLLRYLVSVKDTLSNQEMAKLRDTKLFPAECKEGETPAYYRACDLLVPSSEHTALQRPVIKWPGRFRTGSDEATLLFELGLRRNPSCRTLLDIASSAPLDQSCRTGDRDDNLRTHALGYFIEHYPTVYMVEYRATLRVHRDGFLPATVSTRPPPAAATAADPPMKPKRKSAEIPSQRVLCLPSECFSNPSSSILGFPILDARWSREDSRFGVEKNPPIGACIDRLSKAPPATHSEADAIFSYFSTRQADLTRSEWEVLSRLPFIPLFDENGRAKARVRPSECYFKGSAAAYQTSFFNFIEYTGGAASFVRACGVRDEPSVTDIATMLADKPDHVLQACGGWEAYLGLLRQIAVNANQVSSKKLWQRLRSSACLVGTREKSSSGPTSTGGAQKGKRAAAADGAEAEDLDIGSSSAEMEYTLVSSSDVVLVDDSVLARKFNPWCAPADELLEGFYSSLGARWLSELVHKSTRPQGNARVTSQSSKLEKTIRMRAPLLLHEFAPVSGSKIGATGSKLVRTAEWLQTHLHVRQVDAIHLYQTFKPTSASDMSLATACTVQDEKSRGRGSSGQQSVWLKGALSYVTDSLEKEDWYLLIAPLEKQEWDPFDVSSAIGSLVLDTCRIKDILLISTLLTSSLDSLRRKGFPVDRVLRPRASQIKAPPLQQAPTPTPSDAASSGSRDGAQPQTPTDQPPSYESLQNSDKKQPNEQPQPAQSAEERIAEKQVKELFPSMDEAAIRQGIQSAARSIGANATVQDIISRATNSLLDSKQKDSSKNARPTSVFEQLRDRFVKPNDRQGAATTETQGGTSTSGPPPPPSQQPQQPQQHQGIQPPSNQQRPLQPVSAVSPQQTQMIRSSLEAAVRSTPRGDSTARNNQQFDLDINRPMPTPPQIQPFSESGACASIPIQRLQLIGKLDGVEVFVDIGSFPAIGQNAAVMGASGLGQLQQLPAEYRQTLAAFVSMMRILASHVFKLDAGSLHVFVDKDSPIIAFNRARSLFFNLRYFVGLGHADVIAGRPSPVGTTKADVFAYWFMTFCHELAHHFAQDHDASHGFYMASFAEEYMSKLIGLFSGSV
ncbi:hypothetical protein GQ54DRAFT_295847 [Martensiomyces pterosporus]|nr:hypothetical protein GQ54DRAFT_295847 [Martensiomyces pterosporus]